MAVCLLTITIFSGLIVIVELDHKYFVRVVVIVLCVKKDDVYSMTGSFWYKIWSFHGVYMVLSEIFLTLSFCMQEIDITLI